MRGSVVALLATFACATQPKPSPEAAQKAAAEEEQRAHTDAVAAIEKDKAAQAEHADKAPLDLAAYRTTIVRELSRLTHSREVPDPHPEDVAGKIPHSTLVLKRIGQIDSFVVATVGYGRLPHAKKGPSNVELLAYVEQYGPNVGKVLAALGEQMHARGPDAPAWKEYDVVMLPKPEQGLQYFDLRPGGQIDVGPGLSITLLKVVPMSEDEYETAQKNPMNEYDDPNSNSRSIQRWRAVVERR
jgi:hypothetical protein